mgnify:CR=1 FL=1
MSLVLIGAARSLELRFPRMAAETTRRRNLTAMVARWFPRSVDVSAVSDSIEGSEPDNSQNSGFI